LLGARTLSLNLRCKHGSTYPPDGGIRCFVWGSTAEAQQLRIASAERYYLDALRMAEQHVGANSVAAALPASLIARIRYEQGRLDEAEAMLIDRVSLINAGAMLDCVLSAYLVMARIAVHRMNLERAHALLELAENDANRRGWGRLSAAAVLERARLCLNEGRIDQGAECVDRLERLASEHPAPTNCAWSDIRRYAALARAYVASAQERSDDALPFSTGCDASLRTCTILTWRSGWARIWRSSGSGQNKPRKRCDLSAALSPCSDRPVSITPSWMRALKWDPCLQPFQQHAERTGSARELMSYVSSLITVWKSRYQSDPQRTLTSAIAETLRRA
jgi:LuxR family transcriptional regulator, maltose regulon positive regulatory protein